MLYFPFCVSASAMPSAAFSFCVRRRALPFGSAGSSSRLPIAQPFQIDDRFSDLLKHALDLVEAALTDGNADPAFKNARLFFCRFQNGKLGGSVGLSSPMSSPSANACRSSSVTFPSITASYTFETCDFGESSRWERAPSFVISSSPSVSLSSPSDRKEVFSCRTT